MIILLLSFIESNLLLMQDENCCSSLYSELCSQKFHKLNVKHQIMFIQVIQKGYFFMFIVYLVCYEQRLLSLFWALTGAQGMAMSWNSLTLRLNSVSSGEKPSTSPMINSLSQIGESLTLVAQSLRVSRLVYGILKHSRAGILI